MGALKRAIVAGERKAVTSIRLQAEGSERRVRKR
jgi:hypothetical protein